MEKQSTGQSVAGDRSELLRTRLTLPRLRGPLVEREALFARLDAGLERKMILLSAPAGSGKSTLVSSWIASRSSASDWPQVAWISLDEGDSDPRRFWSYVFTACQVFQPGIGQQSLDLLARSPRTSFETVLTLFLNELTDFSGRALLVLEDYHVIHSPIVHETLGFFLTYLPDNLHLVLLTRHTPAFQLARWRVHHDLCELRAQDLQFSLEETASFLQQALAFPLSSEMLINLHQRTEGWVAALRLLSLALQGQRNSEAVEELLGTFSGSHQHILEYLVADVLNAQPAPVQMFLLQTSLLDRLTGSLCAAVTGREDSARLLLELDQANLFLTPLDSAGQWYRYHALFAEAMQHEAHQRLGEEYLCDLAERASRWYEEHGLLHEAIEAAFRARNPVRAADLIESIIAPVYPQNEAYTLKRWASQLPEAVLLDHPAISFFYAMVLLFTSDRYAPATRLLVERPLQLAERTWEAARNRSKLGQIRAFRSMILLWQDDLAQAVRLADESLEMLAEEDLFWRGSSLINLALGEMQAGQLTLARQRLIEGRRFNQRAGNSYAVRASLSLLSQIYVAQGDLRQAADLYQEVLASAQADQDFTDQGQSLCGLAELDYAWNQLDAAQHKAVQALALAESLHEDELLVSSSLLLARLQYLHGEVQQSLQHLSALAIQLQHRPRLLNMIYACHARLALASGDLPLARSRLDLAHQVLEDASLLAQERFALLEIRLLLASGQTQAALNQLPSWLSQATEHGQTQILLELLLLQALAYQQSRDLSQARQTLLQALLLACPGGYQRLFLDEGEPLLSLLQSLLPDLQDKASATYASTLLTALSSTQLSSPHEMLSLPAGEPFLLEPLSRQERRVLRLLSAGRSNPEIASELVVSVNTVKTQVQSIYHKLNVNSRQQAREAARRLRLL